MDVIDISSAQSTEPSVTIIIPIRNMENRLVWVGQLIARSDQHLIIVNDGSTDDTLIQLQQLIGTNTGRVTLISGDFGGPGQARNAGLDLCSSEYLAFFDSDDENFGGAGIEKLLKIAIATGAQIVGGGFEVRDIHSNQIFRHSSSARLVDALESNPGIWRFLFRQDFIFEYQLRFSQHKMGEDLLFLLDCQLAGGSYMSFEKATYRYRIGDASQATRSPQAQIDLLLLLDELKERFGQASTRLDRRLIALLWLRTMASSLKNLKGRGRRRAIHHFIISTTSEPSLTFSSLQQLPKALLKRVALIDPTLRIEGPENEEG